MDLAGLQRGSTLAGGEDLVDGMSPMQKAVLPNMSDQASSGDNTTDQSGSPLAVLIFIVILLVALGYWAEKPESKLNPGHIRVGGYNIIIITLVVAIGLFVFKFIFNKYQVSGITQFFNAV
jgi:hypothetical protein